MSFNFYLPGLRDSCRTLMTVAAIGLSTLALADDVETARNAVARADEVRFPRDGFQVQINIESTIPGEIGRAHV